MELDIYARISDDQLDDAHGTDTQIAEARAWAAERGHEVVDVYRDDSVSATKGRRRPGFEALLARPVRRDVLVWHVDRLVRVSADLERVIERDLVVHAIHAGLLDLSTVAGRAVARTITAWSTYEGEIKVQRQVAANRAQAARGRPRWRTAPYGHNVDGTLVPREAQVLREAAERILGGHSVRSTRMWLQTVPGAPTTNVSRLLTNPRLAGHNVYRGERVEASDIEPILDEDTYSDLVRLLTDPARRTSGLPKGKVSTLLTGIALCGACGDGTTVRAASEHRRGVMTPLYRCRLGHNQHRRAVADTVVEAHTLDLLTSPGAPALFERHSTTPTGVREELRALRAQMDEWQSVAAELGAVEYMRVTRPLKARLAELEAVERQTSHRSLFEGLGIAEGLSLADYEAWRPDAVEAAERWRALPLLKRREIVSTLWTITLLPPARPRGPASAPQWDKVVMVQR